MKLETLEQRLAETLRREAMRLPDEGAAQTLTPALRQRSKLPRPSLAAPVAAVVVAVIAAPVIWISAGIGGGSEPLATLTSYPGTTVASDPATTVRRPASTYEGRLGEILEQLPAGLDLDDTVPLFASGAEVEAAALDYLESRGVRAGVGVGISSVEEQDGYTLVGWAWGSRLDGAEAEEGEGGWLVMRPTDTGYEVLVATTDGVDLSQVSVSRNGFILGGIVSDSSQWLGVDVLNLDGTPVDYAPNPEGMPDADSVWGTAAAGVSPLGVAVQTSGPVLFRVVRVGGAFLSVSEVGFGEMGDTVLPGRVQDFSLREPVESEWTELPGGLSVAVIAESGGRYRIWVKSEVLEPAPAPSTDTGYLPVPISTDEVAVLIPSPDFFNVPLYPGAEAVPGIEQTAEGQPRTAIIHWGFEGSDVENVTIDWESDPRFGIAIVSAREADIVDVEYVANS